MVAAAQILAEVDSKLPESVSLLVGRMNDDTIDARRLLLQKDAASAFRDQCADTRKRIAGSRSVPYGTNAELDAGEVFIIDDAATLLEIGSFRALSEDLAAIPTVAATDLDSAIKLYTVVLGDTNPIVFVRRTDPRITYGTGRFLAIGRERLARLNEPAFAFASDFDFLVGDSWAVVLNQKSFEMLFRDIGLVQRHIDHWIKGITTHLPMGTASVASLREVALRDSRTWRKLREIERRGHLQHVKLEEVKAYAKKVGLDPKKVVQNGELVFDPSDRFGFLHLLNEDLYHGPLTDEVFESQRKASMA